MKKDSLEEIKLELYRTDLLYSDFKFDCFNENMLTYSLTIDNVYHEINLINDIKSFFPKEKAIDLIDRDGLKFLQHCIYLVNEGGNERIGNKIYSPLADSSFDKIVETGYFYNDGEPVCVGDIMHDPNSTKTPYIVRMIKDIPFLVNVNNHITVDLIFCDKNDYEKIGNFYEGVENEIIDELLYLE